MNLSIPLFKGSNFTQLKQTRIQMKQLEENRINTETSTHHAELPAILDNMAASSEQVVSNKSCVSGGKGRTIAEKDMKWEKDYLGIK